jgi:hypothetical protein
VIAHPPPLPATASLQTVPGSLSRILEELIGGLATPPTNCIKHTPDLGSAKPNSMQIKPNFAQTSIRDGRLSYDEAHGLGDLWQDGDDEKRVPDCFDN